MPLNPYGAGTDVGLTREHNEDAYLVNDELGLWVVADGMGGHEAGEVASAIAVQTVNAAVARGEGLERAMNLAHRAVLKGSRKGGPGVAGMGCTCVAARLQSGDFEIAWVGDSRAYHWNGDELSQLSHDHSYVQTLVDLGVINEQEAIDHPDRSVLTQCLGSRSVDELEVGIASGQLKDGESLLLCSDGLTGEVDDGRIAEILNDSNDEQVAVDRLIIAALENGGSDNVTVVVVSAGQASAPARSPGKPVPASTRDAEPSTPRTVAGPGEARPAAAGQPLPPEAEHRLRQLKLADSASRGGAAATGGARGSAVQRQQEAQRRAEMGKRPRARRHHVPVQRNLLVRLLFMRIAPAEAAAYVARRLRGYRRAAGERLAPVRRRFALIGVYSRRAVLALGLVLVSVGVAGGVLQGG